MSKSWTIFLALAAILLASRVPVAAQGEDATKILTQANGGVMALVIYGADKAEVAKGSAMALAEDILATAYHVVSQAYDVEVLTVKGKKIKVDGIIGIDKAHDVALLKLKGKVQALNVSVAGHEALTEGARLFAIGSNESGMIAVSEGALRRFVDLGPGDKIMELALATPTPSQFSGAPILDIGGQVVGMLIDMDRGVKVGLPVDVIQKISRSGKAIEFKTMTREDYFSLFEGASFAGRAAAGLDELTAAGTNLEKAVKLNPAFTEGFALLAAVYDKQRDYSAAVEAYRKVTALDGSRGDMFYGLGSVLMRMMKYQEAAEAYEKAISLNVNSKEIYFELGGTYEALQNWAKAAEAYEKYLALKPEIAWNGYLSLGICRMNLQQYDASIAALLEARKAQPKDLKVNKTLAGAYEKAGQLEKAEEVYNAMAVLDPNSAKAYYSMAIRMYDTAGKYDRAVDPAKKIVALDPKNEMNIYNVGLMYLKLQKYEEAIEAFRQALALKPDFSTACFQIGSAYFQQKKYREAVEPYKKYTELVPDDPMGWLNVGVSYMFIASATKSPKDFEMALEPMKKAVDLKPDNPNALYNLAIVYLNLKDNFSAREIYKKLSTIDPGLADRLKKFLK